MEERIPVQPQERFPCHHEECGFEARSRKQLKNHSKKHRPLKYLCDYCDYRAKMNLDLQKHLRSHTQRRPYKCEVAACDQWFTQSSSARRHEQVVHHLPSKKRKNSSNE